MRGTVRQESHWNSQVKREPEEAGTRNGDDEPEGGQECRRRTRNSENRAAAWKTRGGLDTFFSALSCLHLHMIGSPRVERKLNVYDVKKSRSGQVQSRSSARFDCKSFRLLLDSSSDQAGSARPLSWRGFRPRSVQLMCGCLSHHAHRGRQSKMHDLQLLPGLALLNTARRASLQVT